MRGRCAGQLYLVTWHNLETPEKSQRGIVYIELAWGHVLVGGSCLDSMEWCGKILPELGGYHSLVWSPGTNKYTNNSSWVLRMCVFTSLTWLWLWSHCLSFRHQLPCYSTKMWNCELKNPFLLEVAFCHGILSQQEQWYQDGQCEVAFRGYAEGMGCWYSENCTPVFDTLFLPSALNKTRINCWAISPHP